MSLSLRCEACGKPLKLKDELAGKKIKCPACGQGLTVPPADEPEGVTAAAEVGAPEPGRAPPDRNRRRRKRHQDEPPSLARYWPLLLGGTAVILLLGLGTLGLAWWLSRPG